MSNLVQRETITYYPNGSKKVVIQTFEDDSESLSDLMIRQMNLSSISSIASIKRLSSDQPVYTGPSDRQCEMRIEDEETGRMRLCCNSKQDVCGNVKYCFQHRAGSAAYADSKPAYKPSNSSYKLSNSCSDELCKGRLASGKLCSYKAKHGNYGFCGIHRSSS